MPFEHKSWGWDRRRVFAALKRTDQPGARCNSFAQCCEHVHVFVDSGTGEVDYRCERCHDRFCVPCGQLRSRQIARALDGLMRKDKCWFITLTLRGRPEDSLASMIDQLRESWKGLRRLDGWRNNITGGAVMLEVKWSATSGGHWHPHYHIVAHGPGVDEAWLKHAWAAVSRGSDQVKVLPITDNGKALSYVSKYASKPTDPSFLRRQDLLDEAVRTLKGVRLCACFGTWHGTPLSEDPPDEHETDVLTTWCYKGTLGDLYERSKRGDAEARFLLERIRVLRALRHTFAERRGRPPGDDPPAGTAAPPTPTAAATAG